MRYFIATEIKQSKIDMLCDVDGGGNDDFQFRPITACVSVKIVSVCVHFDFFPMFQCCATLNGSTIYKQFNSIQNCNLKSKCYKLNECS